MCEFKGRSIRGTAVAEKKMVAAVTVAVADDGGDCDERPHRRCRRGAAEETQYFRVHRSDRTTNTTTTIGHLAAYGDDDDDNDHDDGDDRDDDDEVLMNCRHWLRTPD